MSQHALYFDAVHLSDDSYEMFQFEQALKRAFDAVVNDAFFEEARQQPYIAEIEVRIFFRFDACGCSFCSQAEAGFSYLTTLTAGQARLNSIHLTARDWCESGMNKELAWKLSVKDTFNEQARQTLPLYHEQVSRELWSHLFLAARNALLDYLLTPADDLSSTCPQEHWNRLCILTDNLAKVTLYFPPHAIVYRCNLFTPEDEDERSYNTNNWNQAATLELFSEEPYATFLQRDIWADLSNILAATGLNPALTVRYEDSNGKAVLITL